MKYLWLFFFCFLSVSFPQINDEIGNDVSSDSPSSIPITKPRNIYGVIQGGREKTANGTLRVLFVFVRFKDDYLTKPSWPDYNTLPSWAQNIVDPNIPSNNIYSHLNLSNFF